MKLLHYFEERIGERLPVVVTGVEEFGLFVQGTEIPAEGLIHISTLGNDYYHFDKESHSLVGRKESNRFQLGDRLEAEVVRVDVDRRELDFRCLRHLQTAPRLPGSSRPGSARGSSRRPDHGKRRGRAGGRNSTDRRKGRRRPR